jgi:hypothetical protein
MRSSSLASVENNNNNNNNNNSLKEIKIPAGWLLAEQ